MTASHSMEISGEGWAMWDWLYRKIRFKPESVPEPDVAQKFWCRGCRGLMNLEYLGLVDGAVLIWDHGYPAGLCETHQRRTKLTADDVLDVRRALDESDDFLRGGLRPSEPDPAA